MKTTPLKILHRFVAGNPADAADHQNRATQPTHQVSAQTVGMAGCRTAPVRSLTALAVLAAAVPAFAAVMVFDQPETAALCGYRVLWDTPVLTAPDGVRVVTDAEIKDRGGVAPFAPDLREGGGRPAALAFDAIHRSLLIRFPGAAEAIAERLNAGFEIARVDLALPFDDEELWPEGSTSGIPAGGGYLYRANWGTDALYRAVRPTWHAVAWGLRRPWKADPERGPTYNAYINGAGYWTRFGAQDESADRVPLRFGPTPVHHEAPDGLMDITATLTDPAFGATPGDRLRRLADCGFMVRKWETYDHRYFTGVYEWSTGTGPRAIVIGQPRLIVTLTPAERPHPVVVPPAADIDRLAETLVRNGTGGTPTAVMPAIEDLLRFDAALRQRHRAGLPDWQQERIDDLFALAYGADAASEPFWYEFVPHHIRNRIRGRSPQPDPMRVYEAFVDDLLGKPYRGWHGFEAGPVLTTWFIYRDALPLPARESFKNYWTAWLMPDRDTASIDRIRDIDHLDGTLVHPMVQDDRVGKGPPPNPRDDLFDNYWAATRDWRGNKSFYRSGFNYMISTVNFNNTASMGALLGGALIDSPRAIADGRHGQANFAMKLWTWTDGSSQEEGDDYYFGVTMRAQKMVADFGPDIVDRLLGRSMLLKGMTMLVDTYHPGLRRYITGASRTALHYRLATQDGLYNILHTLSRQGTLTDMAVPADSLPEGSPSVGREFPPDQVARGAAYSPYAPVWYQRVIDEKPLPYEVSATYKRWGHHRRHPLQRKTYLGRNFGLYTMSTDEAFLPAIAQWRRHDRPVETSRELGTLLVRMGINQTRFVNDAPGWIQSHGGGVALQSGPMAILAYSPWGAGLDARRQITSIQATVALYNYEQPEPTWDLFVNEERLATLPFTGRPGDRITIRDGVTYIGIVPLPGSDLGGGQTVTLRAGEPQRYLDRHSATAALVIDNTILQRDTPLEPEADWNAISRAGTGFAIVFADAGDDPDFETFQRRIRESAVRSDIDPETGIHEIAWACGGTTLEMGVRTTRRNNDVPMDESFTHRRVNGAPADLPAGIERDSPFSVHGTTGRLVKHGATLVSRPGQHAVLQTEPHSGIVLAANPLAELNDFALTTPSGIEVTAAGQIGLAILTVDGAGQRVAIEHAFLPEQATAAEAARVLHLFGLGPETVITLNGDVVETPATAEVEGRQAVIVPL